MDVKESNKIGEVWVPIEATYQYSTTYSDGRVITETKHHKRSHIDADPVRLRNFIEERGLAWVQGLLGDEAESVLMEYGIYGMPTTLLIGPDGRIIASELREENITAAVRQALGQGQ